MIDMHGVENYPDQAKHDKSKSLFGVELASTNFSIWAAMKFGAYFASVVFASTAVFAQDDVTNFDDFFEEEPAPEEEPVEEDVNAESEKETKADDKDNKEADKEDLVFEEEVEEDEDSDEDPDEDEEDADSEEEEDEEEESEEDDLNASMASDNFDAEFYANTYPDVVAVFGSSPEALYKHYLDYGKAEGRSCNAEEYALLNESNSE